MKKRIVALTMIIAILCSLMTVFAVTASAATTYDCDNARVITVQTKSGGVTKPSITFKCKADKEFGSRGISNYAPKMSLKVYDHKTGKTTWKQITGSGKSISSKLTLEKGRKYTITVSYIFTKSVNYNAICVGGGKTWAEGTWWISSTNRLSSYKVK